MNGEHGKGSKGGAEGEEGAGVAAGSVGISRSKVFTGKKEEKYAGMSRKKRSRTQLLEEDELERQRDKALQSHAQKGAEDMFASDGIGKSKGPKAPKLLSGSLGAQKAAKAAYRKGTLVLDKGKDKSKAKKRKTMQAEQSQSAKRFTSDADIFKEALDKELANNGRKPRTKKNNKKQAVASRKSFKSPKRMKRR
jgi:hypothetical protein